MTETALADPAVEQVDLAALENDLVGRADALLPLLRAHAAEADAQRRLSAPVLAGLRESGLHKVWVPRRYGGFEANMRTQISVCAKIAEGCPSTAWVLGITSGCSFLTSLFPERTQDEVFGADPDALVCGQISPLEAAGALRDDGLLISGKWGFASGCLHAQWAALAVPVLNAAGEMVSLSLGLVPMAELDVKDTWHVLGMRGTGSNTLVGNEVLIPLGRVLTVMGPDGALEGHSRTERKDEALYRTPLGSMAALALIGPALGMARAALRIVLDGVGSKSIAYTTYATQRDSTSVQIRLAKASAMIDTAHLHVYRAAADADAAAQAGVMPDLATRVRIRHDVAFANHCVRDALHLLLTVAGASAMAEQHPLQKITRDLSTASLHGLLQDEPAAELYGRVLAGLEPGMSPVF